MASWGARGTANDHGDARHPGNMKGAHRHDRSLTPALSRREREMRSALRATFTLDGRSKPPQGTGTAIPGRTLGRNVG